MSARIPIGVNIIPPETAEVPSNLNEHPGRFVGFFIKLSNGDPSFIWLSRNLPDMMGFSHLHIYYVNRKLKCIEDGDKRRFASKGLVPHLRYCVVNLVSRVPRFLDLSVLIQALEMSLSSNKLSLSPVQYLGVRSGGSILGNVPVPTPQQECYRSGPLSSMPLWNKIQKIGYKWSEISTADDNPGRLNPDFDVLSIELMEYGHSVYGIHYKPIKTLLILVPHPYIFHKREVFNNLLKQLKTMLRGYWFRFIGAIRYFGSPHAKCRSDEILKACLLALEYPMSFIKFRDADLIIDDYYLERKGCPIDPASQFSLTQDSVTIVNPTFDPASDTQISASIQYSQRGEGYMVQSREADMNITASELSTQATVICRMEDIMSELRQARARCDLQFDITQMMVPPKIRVTPYDNSKDDFLSSRKLFYECLESFVNLWEAFVSVRLMKTVPFERMNISLLDVYEDQFIVQPIMGEERLIIIIVDKVNKNWGYLNPYFGDTTPYTDMVEQIAENMEGLRDYTWRPIALSSHYHVEYEGIHILMGIFYIGKLFKYAKVLPQKVFYQETHFRQFCWRLCEALQESNADYNLQNRLVRANEYLGEGGIPPPVGSPVSYVAAVVSTKECPFCLRRGSGNMGAHMSMSHGNKAREAREMRNVRAHVYY